MYVYPGVCNCMLTLSSFSRPVKTWSNDMLALIYRPITKRDIGFKDNKFDQFVKEKPMTEETIEERFNKNAEEFDSLMVEMLTENKEMKELLKLIHEDLLMRSDEYNGETVVGVSNDLWKKIKEKVICNK